ncbi:MULTISPECIES: MMPL family transporter [unclassified Mycolicibacterium]|uniref:MMPL family transporter n=1 Tax=unclassified Mycolicibacterium TaxID=2636767 RepID=UPI0012DF6708|nr:MULTISPECIES: MMPL family transporter [unclassified Mycolicibacterium]MUL82708.1 MMPL family transporter [Mycolicibacterium sp. CBMA 329]MUL89043.1 MMPL family transporter [Mycolicibacterium sp. CBMA 331]MUL97610.1 MMPL family transporter [Mycolicibacterium sp. CBMA 334]MUM26321.1 MMPL family transporter [Mycolicibacterium sp. CBMA 295]MUM38559.1 MMPL family transporter [Mycolicibacterium sp. CBMA 247]
MHNLAIFGKLTRVCAKYAWLILGAWLALSGVLNLAIPQLEHTVAEHSAPFTPESPTTETLRQMSRDFGVPDTTAIGSIVVSSDRVLGAADTAYYRDLVSRLVADKDDVAYVLDTYGTPGLEDLGLSPDGKAIHLIVATTGDVGSTRAHRSTENVRAAVDALPRPPGVDVHFTGAAPTLSDLFSAIDTSLAIITVVSVVLITLLLLAVYRSLLTALIPLLTVGISLGVARPVISWLGGNDLLSVSNFTIALVTAMVLGAGTDYGIFLLANYHEGRRRGMSVDDSVARSGAHTAGIVIASALTIAGAGMAMVFTKIGMFRTAGPPIALSIAITMAVSLTLTPAIMALWGRRGYAEPRPLDERRWRRRGAAIVRRAPALVAASLAFLLATSSVLFTFQPNIDENAMQLRSTDSKRGYDAVYQHWGVNEAAPEFVTIRADHDMRNTNDLAALDLIAMSIGNIPQVAYVRSITRPDGKPLPETAIGSQTAQVGEGLSDAHDRVEQAIPQLKALAAGVTQLHDGSAGAAGRLPELAKGAHDLVALTRNLLGTLESANRVVNTVSDGSLDVAAVVRTMSSATDALDRSVNEIDSTRNKLAAPTAALHAVFDPLTAAEPAPDCTADSACMRARQAFADLNAATGGRALGAINGLALAAPLVPERPVTTALDTLPDLRAGIKGLRSMLDQLGTRTPEQTRQDLNRLISGINELSTGLGRLTTGLGQVKSGTDTMVALTTELSGGLNRASDFLHRLSADTSTGAGRGFYLPEEGRSDRRFTAGERLLIAPDGRSARMMVVWAVNPYGAEAMGAVPDVVAAANNAATGTVLEHATIESTGLASLSERHIDQTWRDFALFGVVAVAAVLLVLIVMLRSLVAPVLMIAAVVLSFGAAAGMSTLIWQHIIGVNLDWSVFPVSFMALVAVGADYSMLFAARIREESHSGVISGIIRGFGSTGSVITTAGVVFAITMFALTSGTVLNLVQIGSTVGIGLLLDITVVRTYLVPAAMSLLGERMWWPAPAR